MMAYGSRERVKELCGIKSTNTNHDSEIDDYLAELSRSIIDNALRAAGANVPLVSVPVEIDDAANNLAAGAFDEDQVGRKTGDRAWTDPKSKRGQEMLKTYIAGHYRGAGEGNGPGGRRLIFRRVRSPYESGGRVHDQDEPL
jgi:hypothetical protein